MRGGPRGARATLYLDSRPARRVLGVLFVVLYVGFGVAVPTLVLAANGNHRAKVATGGVQLTAAEAHGRSLFAAKCATCHTLAAANAVGRVGPNLDLLRPPAVIVQSAISQGRARGNGQMPAMLYDGKDAQDVVAFVTAVAGH
ncbi:MAG: cytochrome c [Actinobacteria bacterium]|nr:MAG: cytochrome c [Actinomycetota bacterium]